MKSVLQGVRHTRAVENLILKTLPNGKLKMALRRSNLHRSVYPITSHTHDTES